LAVWSAALFGDFTEQLGGLGAGLVRLLEGEGERRPRLVA